MFTICASLLCLQTFIVVPNVTYTDTKCTDLAAIPFSDYTYLGVSNVKCIGPGEGYQFNYPANVVGAPPTVGGQYYCIKFKNHNNAVSFPSAELCMTNAVELLNTSFIESKIRVYLSYVYGRSCKT